MATIKFNKTVKTLPVSVVFVDKYLPKANATYVKVYIYAYRHSFIAGLDFGVENIAKDLGILETDVINAFEYWKSEGVIKFEEKDGVYYMNPGSVSIPKEESHHGYMTFEHGEFLWKDFDGNIKNSFKIK